ncbi:hypothetical protein T01_8487 [Trichinella spiralis]|uniref:Uncharacterized protein n=1 Tax=Trichinella spiralis TaxID=6334 RepID=A0A0V1AY32_TRISP|nr:hypothetical protein T01_8487 [Trichinella spiralis]
MQILTLWNRDKFDEDNRSEAKLEKQYHLRRDSRIFIWSTQSNRSFIINLSRNSKNAVVLTIRAALNYQQKRDWWKRILIVQYYY